MKLPVEALGASLERELGAGSVIFDPKTLASYAVDGRTAKLLCFPSAPGQVGAALRVSAEAEASVVPWGGGTSAALGNRARELDIIIALEKLDRLIEHDDANLTATAQAGMRLATFQGHLGQRAQFLPLDPPFPSRATIGGLVAANSNGPRRMSYGGVRDLVIGMKMVLANGNAVKAGGKVVKNVAGYDMCKLFVGSLGTLGIITEVTFKLAPIPESSATLVARGSLPQGGRMAGEIMNSALLPAAVTLLDREAAAAAGLDPAMPALAVWVEGFEEAVARHLGECQVMAQKSGLTFETLRGAAHERLWEKIRDFSAEENRVIYRLTLPLASVMEAAAAVGQWGESPAPARVVAHAGSGTIWISLGARSAGPNWFSRLAALAQERGGHLLMAAAPPEQKEGVDVWSPPPQSLSLMREIKRQLDPKGLLNPGRFVARL